MNIMDMKCLASSIEAEKNRFIWAKVPFNAVLLNAVTVELMQVENLKFPFPIAGATICGLKIIKSNDIDEMSFALVNETKFTVFE